MKILIEKFNFRGSLHLIVPFDVKNYIFKDE